MPAVAGASALDRGDDGGLRRPADGAARGAALGEVDGARERRQPRCWRRSTRRTGSSCRSRRSRRTCRTPSSPSRTSASSSTAASTRPGMLRAAAKNVFTSDVQGASTLTQQYVKNVLIESAIRMDSPEEREAAIEAAREADGTAGISRKLREAKLAIALEQRVHQGGDPRQVPQHRAVRRLRVRGRGRGAVLLRDPGRAARLPAGRRRSPASRRARPSGTRCVNPDNSEQRRNIVLRLMLRAGVHRPGAARRRRRHPARELPQRPRDEPRLHGGQRRSRTPGTSATTSPRSIRNNPAFGETPERARSRCSTAAA